MITKKMLENWLDTPVLVGLLFTQAFSLAGRLTFPILIKRFKMKMLKKTAVAAAMVGLGFSGASHAQLGELILLSCTVPNPGVNAAIGGAGSVSLVYGVDATGFAGQALANTNAIFYGQACSNALNVLLAREQAGEPLATAVCGQLANIPGTSGQLVWQQSAAYPSQPPGIGGAQRTVAGAVPTMLQVANSTYTVQQFSLACVRRSNGSVSATPVP